MQQLGPTEDWVSKHKYAGQKAYNAATGRLHRINARASEKYGQMVVGRGKYRRRRRIGGRRYRGRGLYTGQGGFFGDMWNRTTGVRNALGAMGRASANPWAQAAGHAAQALGIGDYTVSNDIVDGGAGQQIPQFSSAGPSTVTISHKEYVGDIYAPPGQGFQNTVYGINPGLFRTFPWLSQISANYEEYTMEQLIFTFRSTVTDFNSGTGQVGTLVMATQYNADDAPFGTKTDMLEYDLSMSGKTSSNMVHGVECDHSQLSGAKGKYVRTGPVASGEDLKLYDQGVLNVGISNTPDSFDNQSMGELWVSYTVTLRKPKFAVSRGFTIPRDTFVGLNTAATRGGALNAVPILKGQQNRIGGVLAPYASGSSTGFRYTLPAAFNGYVKIRSVITYQTTDTTAPTTTEVVSPVSNWAPVKDLLDLQAPGSAGQWSNTLNSGIVLADTRDQQFTESHWLVTPPLGGSGVPGTTVPDNQYTILAPTTAGTIWICFQIDIEIYNIQFNYTNTDPSAGPIGAYVGSPELVSPGTGSAAQLPIGV